MADATARAAVVLSVSPLPMAAERSGQTPEVTWSTGNGSPGNVTASVDGAHETLFAYGTEGTSPAPWLSARGTTVLRLFSIAPKRRLLARLTIDHKAALEVVGEPAAPKATSGAIDRLLQILAFGWPAVAAALVAMYVVELRHGNH